MTGQIVTKGRYRGYRFPKRQIQCSPGNSRMRCGKCGGFDFELHVRPITAQSQLVISQQTMAQVAELICLGCLKVRVVDDQGVIQASGRVEPTKALDPDYVAPDPTDVRAEQVRKDNES
jgi:hypothetical protein